MDAVSGLYFNLQVIHMEHFTYRLSSPQCFQELLTSHPFTVAMKNSMRSSAEAGGTPKKKSPESISLIIQKTTGQFWTELAVCRSISMKTFYTDEGSERAKNSGKVWLLVLQTHVSGSVMLELKH